MTNLEDILTRLWTSVGGCRVAALAGMDGLLIERHPAPETAGALHQSLSPEDLAHVVADLTTVLGVMTGEMSRHVGGRIDEVVALSEHGGYLARRVGHDLFCLVVVSASAELDNVRRQVEQTARELAVAVA